MKTSNRIAIVCTQTMLFIFLILTSLTQKLDAQEYQIGNGNDYASTIPIAPFYNYSYSQQIYRKTEINNAGLNSNNLITSISFYKNNRNFDVNSSNWTVFLGNTDKIAFSSNSDWIQAGDLIKAYSGTVLPSGGEGWFTIVLDVPFYYTNENIIVGVLENAPGFTYNANTFFRYHTLSNGNSNRVRLSYISDSTNPNPYNITLNSNYRDGNRNNIKFQIASNCSGTVNGGTSSVNPIENAPNSDYIVTATNFSKGNGVQYRWEFKINNGAWQNATNWNNQYNDYNATAPSQMGDIVTWRLGVRCTHSNSSSYSTESIFTVGICRPSIEGDPSINYIAQVKFLGTLNDLENNSTFNNNPKGYQDFTGLTNKAIQAQGEGVNIYIETLELARYQAWVDWNSDGNFNDTSELIFSSEGTSMFSANFGFIVPDNVPPGNYRLRFRTIDSTSNSININSCEKISHGETEDYMISVVPKCNAKILSIVNGENCGPGNVNVSAIGSSSTSTIRWYTHEVGGTLIGESVPGQNFTLQNLSEETILYAAAYSTSENCESPYRFEVRAEIKPLPIINFHPSTEEVCGESTIVEVTATGDDELVYLVNEDFEDNTLGIFTSTVLTDNNSPNNNLSRWKIENSTFIPIGSTWKPAISSGINGNKFAIATADIPNTNVYHLFNTALTTPIINTVGFNTLTLKFKVYFSSYYELGNANNTEFFTIEYSTNGVNWQTIPGGKFGNDLGMSTKFANITLNLDSFVNHSNFQFRFRYRAPWADGVAIDNVQVFGTRTLAPSFEWNDSNILVFTDPEATIEYQPGTPASVVYMVPSNEHLELFENLNITATAQLSNSCSVTGTAVIPNKTKVWNPENTNSSWTDGSWKPNNSVPTANNCVIVRKPVSIPTGIEAFAKNIIVEETGKVEIESLSTLTITDNIKVNGPAETFVVKHDANLLQLNPNANNVGAIQVEKQFNFVNGPIPADDRKQYNFVISPVVGQNIKTIYPGNPTVIQHREANNLYYNHNGSYVAGQGLSVREPSKSVVPTSNVEAKFKGVPFNGNLSYPIAYTTTNQDVEHGFNLIGNPYPSNLNIESLYNANSSIIEPNFYFWDNRGNTLYVQHGSNYSGDNFAKYNAASGTGVGTGQAAVGATDQTRIPNEYVKVGTAFMVRALPTANGQSIQFSNDYRTNVNSGPGFFGKINDLNEESNTTKDRYWLNFTTPNNVEFMNAIVYFPQGNNGFGLDDTETFGGSNDIYSLVENYELAIQGKGLFHNSDIVPIGFRAFQAGIHKISIMHSEGIFADGQKIYLKDKYKNIVHDLTLSPYEFKSAPGQFNQRFEIVYKRLNISMSSTKNIKNDVEIKKVNGMIQVTSSLDNLSNVEIFSLTGKSLYKKINFESKEIQIPMSLFNNEIIILNALTDKGEWYSKKFIIN